MPKRSKAAVADAPSTLQAHAGFDIITQYKGQEQVDLSVVVQIPGSWFGSGAQGALTAAERSTSYRAQAVEYADVHEFKKPGCRTLCKDQGIRFVCLSDAQDNSSHPGFWISLGQWNRYRHDTYKDRRDEEMPFIRPVQEVIIEAESPAAPKEPEGIFAHFERVSTGKHMQTSRGGAAPKEVVCTWYRCTQPGCKRRPDQLIREVGKGTGQLYRELKKCNRPLWTTLRLESKHSKVRLGVNGDILEAMSFKDMLIHHLRFVKWCIADWQPFARSRSRRLKAWAQGLNPSAGLPHRETCIKLIKLMRVLSDGKLKQV